VRRWWRGCSRCRSYSRRRARRRPRIYSGSYDLVVAAVARFVRRAGVRRAAARPRVSRLTRPLCVAWRGGCHSCRCYSRRRARRRSRIYLGSYDLIVAAVARFVRRADAVQTLRSPLRIRMTSRPRLPPLLSQASPPLSPSPAISSLPALPLAPSPNGLAISRRRPSAVPPSGCDPAVSPTFTRVA